MRILIAHNRYQQRGGEDRVVADECALLRRNGQEVSLLEADNDALHGLVPHITAALGSVYSYPGKARMAEAIARARPDVVHVHNYFPTLSPSIFHACTAAGVPVVHTLHNYRTMCASATLFRDGLICEECVAARSFLPGVLHGCYRSSRLASAVSGATMAVNDWLGTWDKHIAAYIALSDFAAHKLAQGRVPAGKVHIKANFTEDRGMGLHTGSYALFVGRLTLEKGVGLLIEADISGLLGMDVAVAGDGPMMSDLRTAAARPGSRLILKGPLSREATLDLMRNAQVLVIPSLWYEAPLVLFEALSFGVPVICSNTPVMTAAIIHGETGLHMPTNDAAGLGASLAAFRGDPDNVVHMRQAARSTYLEQYTPVVNYQQLMNIYTAVLARP